MADLFLVRARAERIAAASVAAVVSLVGALTLWRSDVRLGGPEHLFWFLVVVASTCAIGAVGVLVLGWRRRLAEVAFLGAGLLAVSVLPLVHGLLIPGVLVSENHTTTLAMTLAVPVGLAILAPSAVAGSRLAVSIGRRWRAWCGASVGIVVSLSAVLLARPGLLPAPSLDSSAHRALAALSLGVCLVVARRHLHLFRIGARPASLAASLAFVHLGLAATVAAWSPMRSPVFWLAHVLDGLAVMGAIVALLAGHRRDRHLTDLLAPVVNREPLIALEIGLEPVVHQYLASLHEKDAATRDHVVRVGELAVRVGIRAGVPSGRLRALGLGALLHDIGKLRVPTEILTKPGRLTDAEFEQIKLHTVHGAALLERSSVLRHAAPYVRWHHERPDGTGYPDALTASQIPLEVAIIAAVDSWDAMTYDRSYQRARSAEDATEVLRSGVGKQWSARAVDALITELIAGGPIVDPVLDGVGRTSDAPFACACDEQAPTAA